MCICIHVKTSTHVNEIVIRVFSNGPFSPTHALWILLTSTEDSCCVDSALSDPWFTLNSILPVSQVTVTRWMTVGVKGNLRMEPGPMQLS